MGRLSTDLIEAEAIRSITAGAARNRRYRARRARGVAAWIVEGDDVDVPEMLIERGLLSDQNADDRQCVGRAIAELLKQLCHAGTRPAVAENDLIDHRNRWSTPRA